MIDSGIHEFWDWFTASAATIAEAPLRERLGALDPRLYGEVAVRGVTRDVLVCSDDPAARYLAEIVVAAAPAIAGFVFHAWRPPLEPLPAELATLTAAILPDPRLPLVTIALDAGGAEEGWARRAVASALGERLFDEAVDAVVIRPTAAGGIALPALRGEIEKLRGRPGARRAPPASEEWLMLRGEVDGQAIVGSLREELDVAAMATRPWHLEVTLDLRGLGGYLDKDELEILDRLEGDLAAILERRGAGVHWGTFTQGLERRLHHYVSDPGAAAAQALKGVASWGYEARLRVLWDPRWRAWRGYLDDGGA